jgi:hypothetical protein
MDRQPINNRNTEPFEFDEPDERIEVSLDGVQDDPQRFPELADSPVGFVEVDNDREDRGATRDPDDERYDDTLTVGADADLVLDGLREFTNDNEVLDDFAERQGAGRSDQLLDNLRQHHSKSPSISGEDIDADWASADQSGEEAVGGTAATPDQDVVEELGAALGINYDDLEPLGTEDKLAQRDLRRWELDPASAEDDDDQEPDDLLDRVADLEELGLLDKEDLAELDEEDLESLIDELDDNVIDDDDDLDDEIDDMDDDFLLGGLDSED